MTNEEQIHNRHKEEIKSIFNEAGLRCEDFDDGIGKNESGKKPDLKITDHDLFIEIKILFPNEEQNKTKAEAIDISKQLKNFPYWINEERPNYRVSLDSARKKFKNYPDNKTMVIFICLTGDFGPSLGELIEGKEYWNFKTANGQLYGIDCRNRDREIRQDKNYEIGALSEYCPKSKEITVYHNSFADNKRKIDPNILKFLNGVDQFTYKFDPKKGNIFSKIIL